MPSPTALSAAQVESAWAILKDCRKQAEPIARRIEKGSSPAATEAATATKGNKQNAEDNSNRKTSSAESAPEKAQNPSTSRHDRELAKIFESLKARLDQLLETRQIKMTRNDEEDIQFGRESPNHIFGPTVNQNDSWVYALEVSTCSTIRAAFTLMSRRNRTECFGK